MAKTKEEFDDIGFTGTWLPFCVLELYWKGELTAVETMLLATIDSFSKKEAGCFASNARLAQLAGCKSAKTISNMLLKFARLKLIKASFEQPKEQTKRRRVLRTVWNPKRKRKD